MSVLEEAIHEGKREVLTEIALLYKKYQDPEELKNAIQEYLMKEEWL